MFLFTISDKLRSDHPFVFLQDGNFHKGGHVAAQLEHPLGCSLHRYLCTQLCCKLCKHQKEQPHAVPTASQGDAGLPRRREDAPCRGLWHGRLCPAPSLQLTWGVRRSSLCRGSPRRGAGWHVVAEHSSKAGLAARRAWPSCLLPRFTAVSAPRGPGGGAGAVCSSQKGGRGDRACPGLRQQPPHVLSEPPSRGGSGPLPTPARNPAPALPGWLQVPGKLLPASALDRSPLCDGRAGEHAPSPLKNARFWGQHPLCEPQPKQPGVNHGQAGAGLARWDTAPWPQALKTMKGSRTCFSDSGRFPRAHELFTAHAV